jgi:hypothetical protein
LFVSKDGIASFKADNQIAPSYIGDASGISASLSASKLSFAALTSLLKSSSDCTIFVSSLSTETSGIIARILTSKASSFG